LVIAGWVNIYAAVYDENHQSIFDLSMRYGKQLIWICAAILIASVLFIIDSKFYSAFAYVIYGISIASLIGVLVLGIVSHGAQSWFQIGDFRLQPAEFAKMATALALAQYISKDAFSFKKIKDFFYCIILLLIPVVLIMLQPDVGSALVYSSFILVFYREGMNGVWLIVSFTLIVLFILTLIVSQVFLIIAIVILALLIYRLNTYKAKYSLFALTVGFFIAGLGVGVYFISKEIIDLKYIVFFAALLFGTTGLIVSVKKRLQGLGIVAGFMIIAVLYVMSVNYVYNNVLKEHQQNRISELLGIESDPLGTGYNVNQSKIAIGSGGIWGKGFLEGTQTKYNFVPEQDTDFIFCTIGEEWGFVGSTLIILTFLALILRVIWLAERQRSSFSRVFGYSVAAVFFFHVIINIGMTIGIMPVIGIPLPFFSYGGSSLWAFTIFLFIFLRLDANRLEIFR
jgi:rod shape determining protein RodA